MLILHTQPEFGAYSRSSPRFPRRRPFMYLNPPYAIESVPSSSGHAIAYRWHSLPRVRRHRAVNLKIVPVTGAAFAVTTICVCVCFLPIHSGHQVRWTYQPGSHRRKVTQEEGHTGGRSHRISHPPSFCGACLHFSREKDSVIPFPRRP